MSTETEEYFMHIIKQANWQFSDAHKISFIDLKTWNILRECLNGLRDCGALKQGEYITILNIWRISYKNWFKVKELDAKTPRVIAQKYISKKEVRDLIINRDKYCLCCGTQNRLSIDHVIPISRGGMNVIDNLQTLCVSCNSKKRDKIIDYRGMYNG